MTPVAIGLFGQEDEPELARWSLAAAIVLAAHVGLVASYLMLRPPQIQGAPESPAVLIDLAPFAVGPVTEQEIAPGPEMEETPPPPEPQVMEQPPPDTPTIAAPIEPMKPKPPEVKPEPRKPPAPRTTAPQRSQREAPAAAAPRAGSAVSASEAANWQRELFAHLKRYQRYSPTARAQGEEGTVRLVFTMNRNGHVLSKHVAGSSGFSDLDNEALAAVDRAQPLPAFPPSMPQAQTTVTVPFRFSLR